MFSVNDDSIRDLFEDLYGIPVCYGMYALVRPNIIHGNKPNDHAKECLEDFYNQHGCHEYYVYINGTLTGFDYAEEAEKAEEAEYKRIEGE